MRTYMLCALSALMMGGTAGSAYSVTLGQVDDFEDGTVEGWVVNLLGQGTHPAPPTNVASGGPAGGDDSYLRLTSVGGASAGSRMGVINPVQWSGNYMSAGVTAITMHLNNLGTSDLHLRILFEKVGGTGPTDIAASTAAVVVPGGSGWTTARFNITPGDLTALMGSVNNALTDATVIRIYHSPTPTFPGPASAAVLGVDNIQAVPEPGTLAASLVGLAWLARRRRAQQSR